MSTAQPPFESTAENGVITPKGNPYVRVTDLERTVIDCCDRIERAGGIEELLHCMEGISLFDESKLEKYLALYNKAFLYQKVGFILEYGKEHKSSTHLSIELLYENIYDVYGMIQANLFETNEERALLRKILVFYLVVGSSCKTEEVTLDFKHIKHIEKLSFSQVRAHLLPVLSRKEKFDFNAVKEQVLSFLGSFLSFTEDERNFIEHFNQREYRPDILFNESSIVEIIINHPMALWKCRPKEM